MNKDEVVNVGIEELNRVSAELIAERFKREAAEAALLDKEAEFSDFVENGALGLHRVAGDGTILWANKADSNCLDMRTMNTSANTLVNFTPANLSSVTSSPD